MKKTFEFDGFNLELICQWIQFLDPKRWNWINFDVIKCTLEYDKHCGDSSIDLCLLGFGIYLSVATPTEQSEANFKKWDKLLREGKFVELKT